MKTFLKLCAFLCLTHSVFAQITDPNDWELSVDHTQAIPISETMPDDIVETVRGLESDPLRIFHYVLNHFDYQAYFGLYKGYEHTFYERAGNDADLCHLLAKMLSVAGYSSEFVEGWMTIPEENLSRWLKTQEDPDGYSFNFNVGTWDNLDSSQAIQAMSCSPLQTFRPAGFTLRSIISALNSFSTMRRLPRRRLLAPAPTPTLCASTILI